ncbi:5-methylthioadenosine/S-adenosylhomocysteine deaminase [Drechslerella dactyloides]|uniref:5-methylthioadenosine/S-adenosylhomocysteine deaminase n=1 Tax=Drechslerella dactyloides TaxID=74499 RepID=A0AAD6IRR8_DREDA|nr:5-methylthioadenosine/S-adenosylhomocysteine deaminase [Drechslerella dactyloides]
MAKSILLRGGTALIHQEGDVVVAEKTDILIVGNNIEKIGKSLSADDAEVLDCTGKLISPGFVDTHHHLWQTQLKGRHANQMLLEYMPTGNVAVYAYQAEDVLIGQLAGMMELVDAGVTTVVDHSHSVYSPQHADAALTASIRSGMRSIFCYSTTFRVEDWTEDKFKLAEEILPPWFMEHFNKLAAGGPYADGRVQLGFGYDALFMPPEVNQKIFKSVRDAGSKLITLHWMRMPVVGQQSSVRLMDEQGLAGPDILISHGNQMDDEEAALVRKHGMSISSTPMTELQMGHGMPMAYDARVRACASLGVDCHSSGAGDMITQMRVGLQAERGRFNQNYVDKGENPWTCKQTVEDAFNLATIKGARACKMEGQIGSIAEGKLADLIIFDGQSPAMVCGAVKNPIASIVMHSSVKDVETVIVDGIIRKRDGKLLPVEGDGGAKLTWSDVARELDKSFQAVEGRASKLNYDMGLEALGAVFRLDWNKFPDI